MKKKNLILGFIFLMLSTHGFSQWTADPAVNTPVCTSAGKQIDLRMTDDGKGGTFIVWKDYRVSAYSADIYVQRVSRNGVPMWTTNGVPVCTQSSDQSTPAIARDSSGGVIISWSDWRTGIERDLFAQRLDSSGNILWTLDGVPVANKNEREHSQKMIADGNGGVICVWEEQYGTWDVRAQRLDANGNRMWAIGGVKVCQLTAYRINPRLQSDKRGGAIITWQDYRNGVDYDIYAQRLDANGNLLWGVNGVAVCTATGTQNNVKIDPDSATKGAYICWLDDRSGIDSDVYAQKVDSNGNVKWVANGVAVCTAAGNQSALDISSNADVDGVFVTWKDARNVSTGLDIYAQRISSGGVAQFAANGIQICSAPNDQFNPNIINDKSDGAIIVWQDDRVGISDVYAQKIAQDGTTQWAVDGVPVGVAGGKQNSPKNIGDKSGGSIFAWEDQRNGIDYDIYAHHLYWDGSTNYGIDLEESMGACNVYPNPNDGICNFRITPKLPDGSLSPGGRVLQIDIYDVYGKRVLANSMNPVLNLGGYFEYELDARELPSGVYHYRLGFDGSGNALSGEIVIAH